MQNRIRQIQLLSTSCAFLYLVGIGVFLPQAHAADNMDDISICEMVADWQAMAEELKTNTSREWYDDVKNKRWSWSKEQEKLIDKLLKVFE